MRALSSSLTPTNGQPWPLTELVALPLVIAISISGLAVATVRVVALITHLDLGLWIYSVLLAAAMLGALCTTLGFVLNLPITVRGLDLLATIYTTELVLSLAGPIQPAVFVFVKLTHIVRAEVVLPAVAVAAWLMASYLATVVRYVVPPALPQPTDPELAQRLEEEHWERDIRTRQLAECASQLARRRSFDVMMLLYGLLVAAVVLGKGANVAADPMLSMSGGAVIGALLLYLAFVELAARQRMTELEKLATVRDNPGIARVQGAVIPALVAVAFGFLIPANISPFLHMDMTPFLSRTGVLWYSRIRSNGGPLHPNGGQMLPMRPVGMASQSFMVIVIGNLITIITLGLIAYCIWLWFRGEKEKARNLPRLLLALLIWPWRLFLGWFRHKVAERHPAETQQECEQAVASAETASRFRRLRATDATLFVRLTFGRLLKAAASEGVPRFRQETAWEYAHRLALAAPDAGQPAEEITGVYCVTRYAGHRPPEDIRGRITILLRQAVNALRRNRLSKLH